MKTIKFTLRDSETERELARRAKSLGLTVHSFARSLVVRALSGDLVAAGHKPKGRPR